jgi:N-dimethylarginine dimethylaminohydrolase
MPTQTETAQSETGAITRLVLKHARDAFVSQAAIDAQWRALNFTAPPDFDRSVAQYDRFLEAVLSAGAEGHFLPQSESVGPDSIYVRDASIVCDAGVVLCSMGKILRQTEPDAQAETYRSLDERVLGSIVPPARLEGGDVAWLDSKTLAVGRGYRTNDAGIAQLRALLDRPRMKAGPPEDPNKAGASAIELVVVPLPHWRGMNDVFHLMSFISPVDRDLAVVYSPLMPVSFRELLLERGLTLVEVPDEEFDTMGTNVLAIAPRRCVMVAGNPVTRRRLERAGAHVVEYDGSEISLKGGGGPTCLTRPLRRSAAVRA